ncbi:MAG TPA: hypothetical protein VFV72_06765 [Candidatus Limnocylindrales bacterium]|nr:hypothetical protein [Candidatus Limnocylindrales bacterium]
MFHAQLYLASGATVTADLDAPLVDKLIGDMLALPGVVPRLLLKLPTRDELEDRAARLRLVAVALGELLSHEGTLQFLAQHARAVVVNRTAVAAIEVSDSDPSAPSRGQARAETQPKAAQPVG